MIAGRVRPSEDPGAEPGRGRPPGVAGGRRRADRNRLEIVSPSHGACPASGGERAGGIVKGGKWTRGAGVVPVNRFTPDVGGHQPPPPSLPGRRPDAIKSTPGRLRSDVGLRLTTAVTAA